jgi:probable HAF family extracellular repeat protein
MPGCEIAPTASGASGQVVGQSDITGGGGLTEHAFRTTATGKVSTAGADLGTLPAEPAASPTGSTTPGRLIFSTKNVRAAVRFSFAVPRRLQG